MAALKATVAKEINKQDITEAETLVFEGRVIKQTGRKEMKAGGPHKSFTLHAGMTVRAPFKTCSLRFEWDATRLHRPLIAKAR